jgi:hypothetical protein
MRTYVTVTHDLSSLCQSIGLDYRLHIFIQLTTRVLISGSSFYKRSPTHSCRICCLSYIRPRVYRLSPTHSRHIHRFSCIRCLVTTVCHQHTRVVSCVSYVWCLMSTVHPKHTRVVLSLSGSNSSNQVQSVATDCDRYT